MAKRTNKSTEKLPLKLLFSREEAVDKIQNQIDKGELLRSSEINSYEDYEKVKADEERWVKYTKELLSQLFTNTDPEREFSSYPGVLVVRRQRSTLREDIEIIRDNIHKRMNKLESIKERIELIPVSDSVNVAQASKSPVKPVWNMDKVFIVHGHDDAAKQSAAIFIEKFDLEPIILHEQSSGGDTIIEKIERYSDVGFGIVLYTDCDVGAVKSDEKNET